jgi:hypothetical protein
MSLLPVRGSETDLPADAYAATVRKTPIRNGRRSDYSRIAGISRCSIIAPPEKTEPES